MQIATKAGGEGSTKADGRLNLPKDHQLMECLGTLDELNSFLGDAKASLKCGSCDIKTIDIIEGIQKDLYMLMAFLAVKTGELTVSAESLNSLIDQLESELPAAAGFVIPGENPASAKLHIARTVCRRCERRLVSLEFDKNSKELVLNYINLLSNLLFLLALRTAYVVTL